MEYYITIQGETKLDLPGAPKIGGTVCVTVEGDQLHNLLDIVLWLCFERSIFLIDTVEISHLEKVPKDPWGHHQMIKDWQWAYGQEDNSKS